MVSRLHSGEPKLFQVQHSQVGLLFEEEILARDAMGRITSRSETIGTETTSYAYDYWPTGRLKQVTVDGQCSAYFTYDANGNRLSTVCGSSTPTASYDEQDRLASQNDVDYTFTLAAARDNNERHGHEDDLLRRLWQSAHGRTTRRRPD